MVLISAVDRVVDEVAWVLGRLGRLMRARVEQTAARDRIASVKNPPLSSPGYSGYPPCNVAGYP